MWFVTLLFVGGLVAGCSTTPESHLSNGRAPLASAEAFIDAFYSFDPARLRRAMSNAPTSVPEIVYYQGWAQGGHYVLVERKPCHFEKADVVRCDITLKDDLIAVLGTGYDVTDTFHLAFQDGRIVSVKTSSNDPAEFDQALRWLHRERPDIFSGPCRGFFKGGPTPQDCVRAVVRGFADFTARRPR